jgi:hypothetical protein
LNKFQLATPGRITFSYEKEDIEKCNSVIKKMNGICPIYRTINDFDNNPCLENTIISRLMFDFDMNNNQPGRELIDARKLHEYLKINNIAHTVFFSGRGFHIFVKVKKIHARELMNPREAAIGAHKTISEEAKIAPDPKTKDLMRIARLPNTINTKSRLFCIPLIYEELYLDRKEIEKRAQRQRLVDYPIIGEPLDIQKYDKPLPKVESYEQKEQIEISDEILQAELPSCIGRSLSQGDCGYFERFAIITALRDLCYSKKDVRKILKKYLTSHKYRHCVYEEEQVDYLFYRQELLFPSCTRLREEGLCVEGCKGQNIYVEV